MLLEEIASLDIWTDTLVALAFIAPCVYGYEFFRRRGSISHYSNAVKFIVSLSLLPVFWLLFTGAKHLILPYNPTLYYLGNVSFALVALLVLYLGMRYLPIPVNKNENRFVSAHEKDEVCTREHNKDESGCNLAYRCSSYYPTYNQCL